MLNNYICTTAVEYKDLNDNFVIVAWFLHLDSLSGFAEFFRCDDNDHDE